MSAVAEVVTILEDDPNRINAMQICLAEVLSRVDVVVLEDAQDMTR
jgi:hypothetical protein